MSFTAAFIGFSAITAATGLGSGIKAGVDINKAKNINRSATEKVEEAAEKLEFQRKACGKVLDRLGEEKLFILNSSIAQFLDAFQQIKNVNLTETETLLEIKEIKIDQKTFDDLGEMREFATAVAGGVLAGGVGGAMTAFGAYGAASTFATASTGTAISTLSGAAASNATLAFFGGGSVAAGGLGVGGGTVILGGLVAGPALLVMGAFALNRADKKLEEAYTNQAEAREITAQLDAASFQCEAIRRRTYVVYNLLARLDAYFLPLVYKLQEVVVKEGTDYSLYSDEAKRIVAAAAGSAGTIKAVLDTALLTEEGTLTEESKALAETTLKPKKVKIKLKKK